MAKPEQSPGFRRAGLTVLVGSAAGYGIGLALTPVISRLFSPQEYGDFAAMSAVVSILVGLSTFRFEILSQRVGSVSDAQKLLRLGLTTSVMWGAATLVLSVGAVAFLDAQPLWLWSGPLVTLASLPLLGTALLTRTAKYRLLALQNFVQGAAIGGLQVAFGLLHGGVGALLTGFGAARLPWFASLRIPKLGLREQRRLFWQHRDYALSAGSGAAINSLAGQLPIILGASLFGGSAAGFLAMAIRILLGPLNIIGQAAAAANLGEAGRLLRSNDPRLRTVVNHGMRDLLMVGIVPCLLSGALGTWLVPLVLGPEWEQTGLFVALLSVGGLVQFSVAPFSQLLNMTGRNRSLLVWDGVRFIAFGLAFAIPGFAGGSMLLAVGAYSAAMVVMYVVLALMCRRAASCLRES